MGGWEGGRVGGWVGGWVGGTEGGRREEGGRASSAHQPQIGDRPLGCAELAFPPRELVREGDHQLAVALALVARQREDARQVVLLARILLLGEVAHHVRAIRVDLPSARRCSVVVAVAAAAVAAAAAAVAAAAVAAAAVAAVAVAVAAAVVLVSIVAAVAAAATASRQIP